MSNRKSRQLAIETMRRLAIGGATHIASGPALTLLQLSAFASNYRQFIETDDRIIAQQLSLNNIVINGSPSTKFYPAPFRRNNHYELVLFRPHFTRQADVVKIDAVIIGQDCGLSFQVSPKPYERGFRFESRGERDVHGYPHVQPTESFMNNIALNPTGASDAYPAIPIAEKRPHSRLFSALIAFSGLDCDLNHGLPRYLEQLQNTGGSTRDFDRFLQEARLTCKELSRAWNGGRGFNNGTVWGRFADRLMGR
jgi:hypothetical protein